MTAIKWWLRIVGSLYLLEGLGLTAQAFFAPDAFAAIWASTTGRYARCDRGARHVDGGAARRPDLGAARRA